ncbi:MAG: hypothetical protein ACR2F8_02950 [Caulobacteraceae bacterium]
MTLAVPFDDRLDDILPMSGEAPIPPARPLTAGERACPCGAAASFFFVWPGPQVDWRPDEAWCPRCAPPDFTPGRRA